MMKRLSAVLCAGVIAIFAAGCGGGGDPAPIVPPELPNVPAVFDFNGTWNLRTQVVKNECDRDVFNGEITIVQSGTSFALTRLQSGELVTHYGTCDPAAKTFDFTYQDRYGTVRWHGAGIDERFMEGWRTLPGQGNCESYFNWAAVLVARN